MNEKKFEIRMLNAFRKTLIEITKDTMTKPGMHHPLKENTQKMITDCLNIVTTRQIEIEKQMDNHTAMKPKFSDEQTTQTFSIDDLKKTLN